MKTAVCVQIPRALIIQAASEMAQIPCYRKEPKFLLFPYGQWKISWTCGTNTGIGSDNGYGVGHICTEDCPLRII